MKRFVGGALLALACGAPSRSPAPAHPDRATPAASQSQAGVAPAPPPRTPAEPILLVTDPEVLAALEQKGAALGDWLLGSGTGPVTNERLAAAPGYALLKQAIEDDLNAVQRRDPAAGVEVARYSHRLFDARWLGSESARFELIGVANRFDRGALHGESCGETRLIYRLSYATHVSGTPVTSRLPMTLGLELVTPREAGGCAAALRRWQPARALAGDELAAFLAAPGAPLAPDTLARSRAAPHRLVANVQRVRWPSAVRPDLGGHAEYLLLAFRPGATGALERAPLENTPDVERIARDPKLKQDLLAWLGEPGTLARVDAGTALLPEPLLAKSALSVTPRGLARRQNRPFRRLLAPKDLAALDLSKLEHARSFEGLARRLDQLSCPGCHEARSIAGFHLLGDDPATTPAGNALATGSSPHLLGELPRRKRLFEAALAGGALDFTQPLAERSHFEGFGAHCGLGDDASFGRWGCADGLVCSPYDSPPGDGVGQCLPAVPSQAGDPCEVAPVAPNESPLRDRAAGARRGDCGARAVCNTNSVGFPGGMCTEACDALSGGAACGSIAVLEPFNACVGRGQPFQDCLRDHVRPAGLRACSPAAPCRDDYVCARGVSGGTCIPPYFLFQLRVDGHPR
jgi:hypothetical protein